MGLDPTVQVALVTGCAAVIVSWVQKGIRKAESDSDEAVQRHAQESTRSASQQADESARQAGVDVGDVVSAAITAAVQPVSNRLALVEGEVRVLRGDLVPVAVADRGIVLGMVADGLVHHGQVVPIPESVAPLYPYHLRQVPLPEEEL